jgi:predicted nucleotidyltransferase
MKAAQLTKLEQSLKKIPAIRLAIVYGSTVKKRDSSTSDLDLAVAFRRPMKFNEKLKLKEAVEKIVDREVDLVDLLAVRGVILEEILGKGDFLIKRDNSLHAFLIKRMWFDRADFMPLREKILRVRRERFLND